MNKQDTIAGVDVGGTYTDLIVFDQSGKLTLGKTPTTVEKIKSDIANGYYTEAQITEASGVKI